MSQINRRKFTLIFKFNFDADIIIYKTIRYNTDVNLMISYAFDWIEKFGSKYGEWFVIEIYENIKLVSIIVNDE